MTARLHRSTTALLLVFALVAAACSGTGTDRDGADGPIDVDTGEDAFAPGDPTDIDGDGDPDTLNGDSDDGDGDGGSASGATGRRAGSSGSGTAGTGSGGGGSTGTGSTGGTATPIRDATLYSGAENTQGITDSQIRMCGHAALVFADAFDTRVEDLNVYWQMVNEGGGVHGRSVEVEWEDDAYNSGQAVQAAERCKAKQPALLLGGIGFDQIPAVRAWAEENRMLYFHHMAVEAGLAGKQFSFSGLPSVERTGVAFGEHLVAKHLSKKIGIVWRQSENWEPGHRAGKAVLEAHGAEIVADLPVNQNQAVYSQQIFELQRRGAEIVWVWENALAAAEMIQQAKAQNYHPTWLVFPFQTTLDIVEEVKIEGVSAWPAYAPGGYEGDPFAEFGYGTEIKRFEAAMAKYRPGVATNDILWQVWIASKAIHDIFERCGPDCTRNRLAGVFLSGLKTTVPPNCAVDFSRSDSYGGHLGGYQFYVLEGFNHPSKFSFRTVRWCSQRLL